MKSGFSRRIVFFVFSVFLMLLIHACTNDKAPLNVQLDDHSNNKSAIDFFPKTNPVTVGCYYYPEQWPENEWDRDLKNMAAIGFEFTHFGEFAWSKMEPKEGEFDFLWLDKAVELASKNNLKVILCTPSPTPPAWLVEKHPEVLMKNDLGIVMQHGSRQQGSWSSKVYQEYIDKIVKALGERYGKDKRVWGWQLDNEPSHYGLYDYNEATKTAFLEWLKVKYNVIDSLNLRWGNSFWSQTYTSFDQIRLPNQKELVQPANPHALLDFQEFSNAQRGVFLRRQAKLLRTYILPNQFITTNYFMQLPHIDPWVNKNDLDFASYTNYPINSYSEVENGALGFRLGSGSDLSMTHDFYQSVNGATGVMELQPGQVNWGRYNAQPLPGAVRMWIWHTFSLGAKFVCTYRYRQPLFGNEQYHQGIIQTDGVSLSRGGKEYEQAIKELKEIKKIYKQVDSQVKKIGILWDQRSMFDLMNFPHNQHWNGVSSLTKFYESLKSFALPIDFILSSDSIDPSHYPILLVPSVQLVDEKMVEKWEHYVRKGGTLLIAPRTGQKNRDGHLWKTTLQKSIGNLIGADILYYDHLPPTKIGQVIFNKQKYDWNTWGEIIEVTKESKNTTVLAVYSDQFYKDKAAVVSTNIGKGKVIYIGTTSIEGALEKAVIKNCLDTLGLAKQDLPRFVYQERRGNLIVTVNYSSMPYTIQLEEKQKLVLGETTVSPGSVAVVVCE